MTEQSKGYLLVSTRTADGLLLVPYADVKVYDEEGMLIFEGKTNRDAYTEEIEVFTPPLAQSMTPGGERPFAEVSILVEKEGFYGAQYLGVPIFPNVISVQSTNLQAIPAAVPTVPFFDSVINESGVMGV